MEVEGRACVRCTILVDDESTGTDEHRQDPKARTRRKEMDMSDRTDLLRKLGKSEFTVRQLADRTGLSVESARGRISKYLDDGLVVRTSDVLQYVDDEGRPMRGRPAHLYRVR